MPEQDHGPSIKDPELYDRLPRLQLRTPQQVRDILDRRASDAGLEEHLGDLGHRMLTRPALNFRP